MPYSQSTPPHWCFQRPPEEVVGLSMPTPKFPGSKPEASKATEELSRTANEYYNGLSLIAEQKYQEAFQIFKKIVEDNIEEEYSAKSFFEIGHCLYLLGKYEVSIKHFTLMITKYPKHPDLGDVLFYIGQCHEKCGRAGQAAGFYKKVISMESDEGTKLKAKRALNKLEA
jgi:TolA-binding protein